MVTTNQATHRRPPPLRSRTQQTNRKFSNSNILFLVVLILFLSFSVLFPLIILRTDSSDGEQQHVYHGIDSHISFHRHSIREYLENIVSRDDTRTTTKQQQHPQPLLKKSSTTSKATPPPLSTKLGRGRHTFPLSQTPALLNASRGHITCPSLDVDHLAYWNDPQGTHDVNFVTPFAPPSTPTSPPRYLTFEPDSGGWNNIRMALETVVVFAAATDRILVMPPNAPLYRLTADKTNRFRGFADFFPMTGEGEFGKRVKIISMAEFLERTGTEGELKVVDEEERTKVFKAKDVCVHRQKDDNDCGHVWGHLRKVGYTPDLNPNEHCFVFDLDLMEGREVSDEIQARINKLCRKRKVRTLTPEMQSAQLIHFMGSQKEYRLLIHFYAFVFFTDPAIDNYHKRLIRDFMHYHDEIFCAAGKIVTAIQKESMARGFTLDDEGGGGYSSMHVRRGELQYKRVKISAQEWYDNLKEIWKPNEIIYIATDERDKTFFDPIKEHHTLRFLDDYFEIAGLNDLDPNYFGMIDTIVAARGRSFAGTWFSTFSGYIVRMRGYYGMDMKDCWYGFKPKKDKMQTWVYPQPGYFAREFEAAWVGIDSDFYITGRIGEDGVMENADESKEDEGDSEE